MQEALNMISSKCKYNLEICTIESNKKIWFSKVIFSPGNPSPQKVNSLLFAKDPLFDLQYTLNHKIASRSFHPLLLLKTLVMWFQSHPVQFIYVSMVLLHLFLGLPGFISFKVQKELWSILHTSLKWFYFTSVNVT